jgi:hypothetical protein
MKYLGLILFALVCIGSLHAQQSVTIKEPAGQCYQDLKANLPEAIRWDDERMTVRSRPLVTTTSGNVELVAQVFQEQKDTMCKIVVSINAPTNSVSWNAANSSALWQNAHVFKARIESAMKAREKENKK